MILKIFALLFLFSRVKCEWDVKQVTEPLNHVEGPHWDEDKQVLYYTDIIGRLVVQYDPATGKRSQVFIDGGDISPVLTVGNVPNQFVVGRGRDLVTFNWDGTTELPSNVTVLATVDADKPKNKFNDGKADTKGRIWAGTIEEDGQFGNAGFFLFQKSANFTPVKKSSATTSNGLAWTDDDKLLYYIDSPTAKVDVFDFNSETAEISNRRTLFNTAENGINGVPDGMTLDADGNLWVAIWGGSRVIQVEGKTGKLLRTVSLPAVQVSSCVWGGKNLDTLYITTSRVGLSDQDVQKQPLAGAVFSLSNTGVRGQKTNKVIL